MFEPFSERAPAKINLALHVLGRRADGYHELDSIVAFADVGDELTFSPAREFAITTDGPFAAGLPPTEDNIVAKAWAVMRDMIPELPPAAVHLVKNLPIASGIGGGSANAAAAIRAAMQIADITHFSDALMAAALSLGADVPVCLLGKACRMQGVGERITPLGDFKPLHAVLVNPGIAVSTLDAFRKLGLEKGQEFATPITIQALWRNDLTTPSIALAPVIGEVLDALRLHLHPSSRSGEGASAASGWGQSPGREPLPSRAEGGAYHLPHRAGREGQEAPFIGMSGFCIFPDDVTARAVVEALHHSHPQWWAANAVLR
jgi:4-diphosphocytidyl-2-C-methyl-D-erythritol kinase